MGGLNFSNFYTIHIGERAKFVFSSGTLKEENWSLARVTHQSPDMQNDAILDLAWHLRPHIEFSRPKLMCTLKILT